jgi:lipoprotein-anchoring transpeptidase ErfK/SrfK
MRRSTRLAAAVAAATLVGLLWVGLGPSHDEKQSASAFASAPMYASLPASPLPALKIGKPDRLSTARYLSRWSAVRVPAAAHTAPSTGSPVVARLSTTTPERTADVVTVLRARAGTDGRVWVEVRLPMLPNGSVGWVSRSSLGGYETVTTHLIIDRERLRATLLRDGVRIFSAPVGIGAVSSPTPEGEFTVRSRLTRYASPFYGPVAFGTTARTAVLTDWPDGGYIGIHGTNAPQLLPGRVSHGCIRLRNSDILRLATLMPVGTPVTIR